MRSITLNKQKRIANQGSSVVGSLIFYFLIKCYLYVTVTMLQWRTRTRDAKCTFGISTLTHGHTRYPGSSTRLGWPGRTKTYPVTAALHESSLQTAAPSLGTRLHDYIFATAATATATGPPTTTLLSSFLQLTMAVLTLLSPKVEAFPLTQVK